MPESTLRDYIRGKTVPARRYRKRLFDATQLPSLRDDQSTSLFAADRDAAAIADEGASPSAAEARILLEGVDVGRAVDRRAPPPGQAGLMSVGRAVDLSPYKTVRLAVSGDVTLTRLETRLIDTRAFQRLHSIKQLGTSYMVYPSATHTRFEHSIGTLHEAATMAKRVSENPKSSEEQGLIPDEELRLIRLAALLHDVTHIPFGHTLEDESNVIKRRHDEHPERREELLVESDIGKRLKTEIGNSEFELLLKIMGAKSEAVQELSRHAYISDIVNNTLCADLLDYLKRDIYFCNLQQSFGDRFLNYLYLDELDGGEASARRLVIRLWKGDAFRPRRDILSELVDLLRVRYYLGEKVYFHHAKASSSAMISRAVWAAMHPRDGKALAERDLWDIGDDELLSRLEQSQDPVAARLAGRLKCRDLYKHVFTLTRQEADAAPGVNWPLKMVQDFHLDPVNRTRVEDQIAEMCGLASGDVLIYCPSLDMAKKYAKMLVKWKDDYRPLSDVDDPAISSGLQSILTSHDLLWGVQVFAKADAVADRTVVETLKDFCHWRLSPAQPDDRERRLESALRAIVNAKMGDAGTPAKADRAVEILVSRHRSAESELNSGQVAGAIEEVLAEGEERS